MADISNLPSFFQANRSSMVTVLDHLENLEGELGGLDEELGGDMEDEPQEGIAPDEEEYQDDDFDMITSTGLPEQFNTSASIGQSTKILDYKDLLGNTNMISNNNTSDMMSKALGFMSEPEPDLEPEQESLPLPPQSAYAEPAPMPPAPVPVPVPVQQYAPPEPHPMDLPPAPAPVPIKQPCTYARIHNINDVKPAKYMSRYDMKFVISRILYPLNTEDPFADDYYFIQVSSLQYSVHVSYSNVSIIVHYLTPNIVRPFSS